MRSLFARRLSTLLQCCLGVCLVAGITAFSPSISNAKSKISMLGRYDIKLSCMVSTEGEPGRRVKLSSRRGHGEVLIPMTIPNCKLASKVAKDYYVRSGAVRRALRQSR